MNKPTAHTIVTLDGPAGVGKTSLAKRIAEALQVAYLDTGAMYRAVAWRLGEDSWTLENEVLEGLLLSFSFSLAGAGEATQLLLNAEPVPDEYIRTETVGMWASTLAKLSVIRSFLGEAQKSMGADTSLVAEGRDMGTVVFPSAKHKFYLDASPEVRAKRRFLQLQEAGKISNLEVITRDMQARDQQDASRAIAPLKPAEDAVIVNTDALDLDGVYGAIMDAIRAKA